MTRKRQPTEPKRATLQVPRSEAEARVREQIRNEAGVDVGGCCNGLTMFGVYGILGAKFL